MILRLLHPVAHRPKLVVRGLRKSIRIPFPHHKRKQWIPPMKIKNWKYPKRRHSPCTLHLLEALRYRIISHPLNLIPLLQNYLLVNINLFPPLSRNSWTQRPRYPPFLTLILFPVPSLKSFFTRNTTMTGQRKDRTSGISLAAWTAFRS